MTIPTGKPLNQVIPPMLPQPRQDYSYIWQDQFANVLRLYFNQLNNSINGLVNPDSGGASLFVPHGVFLSLVQQTAVAINTAKAVQFETTSTVVRVQGLTINGPTKTHITPSFSGTFRVDVDLQLNSNSASSKTVTVWVRKNGIDVPNTARKRTVTFNGDTSFNYNVTMDILADDYVEIMWATTDLSVVLKYSAPAAPYPAVPSAILTVTHVSNVLLDAT